MSLADGPAVESRILGLVGDLVGELRGTQARAAVALDDRLEQDLGISSLERVELLLRLERAFGVRLPDEVMAGARTTADLVRAVTTAQPAVAREPPAVHLLPKPGTPAPQAVRTLTEVLRWHAAAAPDRVHIHLRDETGQEHPITYGALWHDALSVASAVRARGIAPGETVALMLRTEAAFFRTFFGILLAGAVPVPLYPPFRADRLEEYAERQIGILRNAGARLLITFAEAERVAGLLKGRAPALAEVVTADGLQGGSAAEAAVVRDSPGDVALIQYTSGSTGDPKGVVLSHANILANIRAFGEALQIGPADTGVSWLPLYHDMGLIGSWLGALYFAVPIAILSPLAFLSRPVRWLQAIHAHRATISAAPNFAFDLCARRIPDEDLRGLDLSCWRLALNGSEGVSPETIARFTRRFAPFGFRPDALCPVYGLAESSVALTTSPSARLPRIDSIARAPLQQSHRARPAGPDEPAPIRTVSCGRALPGHDVRIVDDEERPVGDRVEGRVEFRGPSVTVGYFRQPEATRRMVHDGWMDSGDLGYQADGELFITGRQKDIIIQGGRNVSPEELEDVAARVPGIRAGCVAAFGVPDPGRGTERLIVVAESRETGAAGRESLRAAVLEAVVAALGVTPDTVVVTAPGAVLKTSSGKIRRRATRDAYVSGQLARRRSAGTQLAHLVAAGTRARLARLAGTAGSVLFTGYVALLLLVTVPALWLALRLRAPGRPADRAVRWWARVFIRASGCPLRVTGGERLRGHEGPLILTANHASYIDSVVLMAALPVDFRFLAKQALTTYPIIGLVIERAGHVTIEKQDFASRLAGADRVVQTIREGLSLAIFPEGTFFRAPGLLPFRLGAFRAAVDAGLPVVPVAIRGTRRILPDGTWWLTRGPIDVVLGAPIRPEGTGWAEMVRLRDRVRDEIAAQVGELPVGAA